MEPNLSLHMPSRCTRYRTVVWKLITPNKLIMLIGLLKQQSCRGVMLTHFTGAYLVPAAMLDACTSSWIEKWLLTALLVSDYSEYYYQLLRNCWSTIIWWALFCSLNYLREVWVGFSLLNEEASYLAYLQRGECSLISQNVLWAVIRITQNLLSYFDCYGWDFA